MTARGWRWVGLGAILAPWVLVVAGCALLPCCRLPLLGDGVAREREISGPVERVVDGDSLTVARQRVRLYGIDAPELHQHCRSPEGPVPCGIWAWDSLALRLAGETVSCEVRDTDRYGRAVALCRLADGRDLGELLVSEGFAVAYRRYSLDYADEEESAHAARRGLWAYEFEMPWDWRKR